MMKHVFVEGKGDNIDSLKLTESPLPILKDNEVLIKVKSTAINRLDILQRMGKYPVPQGASQILGVEASGYLADQNGQWDTQKPVMALLGGGGYAQYCTVNKNHVMPVPSNLPLEDAAAIPEVWITAYLILKQLGQVQKGDNVLIYAGASGVGTSLIQLSKLFGANPYVTVSSQEKADYCKNLGAIDAVNYKTQSNDEIVEYLKKATNNKGFNVILDCVGSQFFQVSLSLATIDTRWVQYGLLSGGQIQNINLALLLQKRINLIFTTLRSRSEEFKTKLIENFSQEVLPYFENKVLNPIIDKKFYMNWDQQGEEAVQQAHKLMESNQNIGKIMLVFNE